MRTSRTLPPLLALALAATSLAATSLGASSATAAPPPTAFTPAPSTVILAWERTSIRTVYTENASPVPSGALYLGFTSLAMLDAVDRAHRREHTSAVAAAAVAAHDVLAEYFPASVPKLDLDLAASLAGVPDGAAKDRGVLVGGAAADAMIASRVDDGRNDATIVYTRPPGPGVWQPAPGGAMVVPWLGYVRPLVLRRLPLRRAARLFAAMHGAMADSVIACWRLKYDVGFWRPNQAIALADTDGNPDTVSETGWTSLLPTPSYSDYTSGHASLTGPAAVVLRRMLGDDTALTLHSYNTGTDRTYSTITEIEGDALNSRIWGGLHFRTAMDDGYALAHRTAARVLDRVE